MYSLAQLQAVNTEISSDPKNLGMASYLASQDYVSLAEILDWVRDGITPCPINNVVGSSGNITAATNVSPIVITSTAHGLSSNDYVVIQNVGGNTAANGVWKIAVIDANTFSLNGSTGNGAYTSGGTWNWCVQGVRTQFVSQQSILGAIDVRDWPGFGVSAAATADQMSKNIFLQALFNQPSGSVSLTNPDGTDNNTAKNIKRAIGNTNGSTTAVTALEMRFGSRVE